MQRKHIASILAASTFFMSAPAAAQALSGEELLGQTVDILFADGTRNAVFFGSTGMARIANGTGQTADANWFVQNDQLCLRAGSATECWNYESRFAAGQAVQLTSTCDETSVWRPRSVNAPREVVAPVIGERG